MKNNLISMMAINSFELISNVKDKFQQKLKTINEYIYLLEREKLLDIKLTKMFFNYIKFQDSVNDNNSKKVVYPKLGRCNIQELINDLNVYYAAYAKIHNISFSVVSEINDIDLPLAKEAMYQIVFSIVDTKLRFLMNEDTLNIEISIKGDALILLIRDSGFSLSSDKISEYTKKFSDKRNIFFLSWEKTIAALSEYSYEIKTINGNVFRAEFSLKKNAKNGNFSNKNTLCYI